MNVRGDIWSKWACSRPFCQHRGGRHRPPWCHLTGRHWSGPVVQMVLLPSVAMACHPLNAPGRLFVACGTDPTWQLLSQSAATGAHSSDITAHSIEKYAYAFARMVHWRVGGSTPPPLPRQSDSVGRSLWMISESQPGRVGRSGGRVG